MGTVNPTLNKQVFDETKDPSKQYIWRQEARAAEAARKAEEERKAAEARYPKEQSDYDNNSANQLGGGAGGGGDGGGGGGGDKRGGFVTGRSAENAVRTAHSILKKGG